MNAKLRDASSFTMFGMTLPPHLQQSIDRYVDDGVPTGGFLQACIENNLKEAVGRADERNIRLIPIIVGYLYNRCPMGCRGRDGIFEEWITAKRTQRAGQ